MIPVLNKGRSFRGAAIYYMTDKASPEQAARGAFPDSSERVAWTETRNLAHEAPGDAIAEMITTFRMAPALKVAGGHSAGRPLQKPVSTIALTWHPSEAPTRDQMTGAADAYLAAMGWQEHQALYVCHTDEPQPHVHIILNRVHPDSGLALDDSDDRRRAQKWAHAYEKANGHIWCEDRAKKYDAPRQSPERKRNHQGKPRDRLADAEGSVRAFTAAESARQSHDAIDHAREERDQLGLRHKAERDQHFADQRAFVKALRDEVWQRARADARDDWREHHRFADAVNKVAALNARAEQDKARAAVRRAAMARSTKTKDKHLALAEGHLEQRDRIFAEARTWIGRERKDLVAELRTESKQRQDEAAAAFIAERYSDYDLLKARQKDERGELKTMQHRRETGRPVDEARLAQLVRPSDTAPSPDAATTEKRITEILDKLDTREAAPRRGRSTMADPHTSDPRQDANIEALKRRKQEQETARQADEMQTTLRGLGDQLDDRRPVEPELARRLDGLNRETTGEAERGADLIRNRLNGQPSPAPEPSTPTAAGRQQAMDEVAAAAREQLRQSDAARERRAEVERMLGEERDRERRQREANQEQAKEAKARADAFTPRDPRDRAAEGLARYYDPANPLHSMARSHMHEHGLFIQEKRQVDTAIGNAQGPIEREMLTHQRDAMVLDYQAHNAWRAGRMSEIVTGRAADPSRGHDATTRYSGPPRDERERAERLYEGIRSTLSREQGNTDARPGQEQSEPGNADARRQFGLHDKWRGEAAGHWQEAHRLREAFESERLGRERQRREQGEAGAALTQRSGQGLDSWSEWQKRTDAERRNPFSTASTGATQTRETPAKDSEPKVVPENQRARTQDDEPGSGGRQRNGGRER